MKRISTILLLIGLLILDTSCSSPSVCKNGINNSTKNVVNSPCNGDCECNNQSYEGRCISGACVTRLREACLTIGITEKCTPGFVDTSSLCQEGIRTCRDIGMFANRWGDCKCPSVLKEPTTEASTTEPTPEQTPLEETLTSEPTPEPPLEPKTSEPTPEPNPEPTTEPTPEHIEKPEQDAGIETVPEQSKEQPPEGMKEQSQESNPKQCTPGTKRPCSSPSAPRPIGVCKGTQLCNFKGRWSTLCTGASLPSDETKAGNECDGKDNDCDGKIDEGNFCTRIVNTQPFADSSVIASMELDTKGALYLTGVHFGRPSPAFVLKFVHNATGTLIQQRDYTNAIRASHPMSIRIFDEAKGLFLLNNNYDFQIAKVDLKTTPTPAPVPFAGNKGKVTTDGEALSASINGPFGLVVRNKGLVYFTEDVGAVIRKAEFSTKKDCQGVTSTKDHWCISTIAGQPSVRGKTDGLAKNASFHTPRGLALDTRDHSLYITDVGNHMIRKLTKKTNQPCPSSGSTNHTGYCVETIAGTGIPGLKDGPAANAQFNNPIKIVLDKDHNLYISDSKNFRIRMLTQTRQVKTISGGGTILMKLGDPAIPGKQVNLATPPANAIRIIHGIAYDKSQHVLYVGGHKYIYEINVTQ